jgi:PAS domain S-box-containing protein
MRFWARRVPCLWRDMGSGDQQQPSKRRSLLPTARGESGERYARLLESLPVGVVIQGPTAEIAFANRAALEILGRDAQDVLGLTSLAGSEMAVHPDLTPFPPEDHPGPRALATARPVRGVTMGVYHPIRKERVWLQVNADPEIAENGSRVESVVTTFHDVTTFKRAEMALQASESRYRQLVEKAGDIIYGTDINGFFTYVNPVASQLLGYPPPQLVGTHFTQLIREDHRQRVADALVLQFQHRTPASYDEFPVLTRDGREMWVGQNVQLLLKGSRVQGFQAMARDITERKRAQEALERERQQLRDIVRHAPVAMAILDRELRYVAHSRKWARLWGQEGQDFAGRAHEEVFPRLSPRYEEAVRRTLRGEVITAQEDAATLADGTILYTRWSLHPWMNPEGGIGGVVTVVQSIDMLVRARQAAEEASRVKSEFLANVSHELRTPLGQLIALGGLLEQTTLDEKQRQWVALLRSAATEVLERFDGILHFARLEAEPLELKVEEFDPHAVAEKVVLDLAEAARAKKLALSADVDAQVPTRVRGDAERLSQALHQLLHNAVKFTEKGSVRLRLRATGPGEEPVLHFEVEDTGPGIDDRQQALLFQPFTQLDGSASRRHGGTGLGLALAHRLAKAMGAELIVRSQPGQGSTFVLSVRLPLVEERPRAAVAVAVAARPLATASAAAESVPSSAPLILVAEDNPINRKVVLAMLEKLGYRGEAVANGLEAVEACARGGYDAVLMDCMMPEMDGYRATAWIRQRETPQRRMPIVAITASTAPGDREKCFAAGMDAYLSKPLSLRALDETLRRWLQGPQPALDLPPSAAARAAGESPLTEDHPLRVLEAQGRPEAVLDIIDLFLQTMPLRLERLREMARDSDLGPLIALAHSIRGAALQLGALGMAQHCADLQTAARAGQPMRLQELLKRLLVEYGETARLLRGERQRIASRER